TAAASRTSGATGRTRPRPASRTTTASHTTASRSCNRCRVIRPPPIATSTAAPRSSTWRTAGVARMEGSSRHAAQDDVSQPQQSSRQLLGALLVICAAALWATFGLFAKRLYEADFTPLELASIRNWIGFIGVALLALS